VPVLIAAARATEPFLTGHPGPHQLAKWLGFMALYDTVFVLLAVAVFDYLLED
jgi:heme exporter protein B